MSTIYHRGEMTVDSCGTTNLKALWRTVGALHILSHAFGITKLVIDTVQFYCVYGIFI